jgi:hypothetical protein
MFTGGYWTGNGLGSFVSALVVRLTGTSVSVLYMAIILDMVFLVLCWLVVPDSLVPAQLAINRASHRHELARRRANNSGVISSTKKFVLPVIEPLAIFVPTNTSFGPVSTRLNRKEWGLLLLSIAYIIDSLVGVRLTTYYERNCLI